MKLTPLEKDKVIDKTYVKLCVNKTHMGPVSEEKVAMTKAKALSAAANKVRVTAGFSIKVATDDNMLGNRPNNQNQSFLFTGLGDDSPQATAEFAVFLMEAWDHIFVDVGTTDYVSRLTKALEARAKAYKSLGINPVSDKKPNLSADQRVVYNSIVGPTGFDYYEYHLAFKLAGQKKFCRSKTYRSLKPLDLYQVLAKLHTEVAKVSDKIILTLKKTN